MVETEEKLVHKESDFSILSEEKLSKELEIQAEVAKEILQAQEEEKIKTIITNPSAIALTTTKHESGDSMPNVRKTTRQLFTLYLTNQFVARAVNIRADSLVSKGYSIVGNDNRGVEMCEKLIEDSGGANIFWQLSVNTEIAGDGFLEKIYNVNKTKLMRLKHVHPLTLEFKRDPTTDKIIIGKDKEPVGYIQYYIDKANTEVEKDVHKERIAHFKFNSLGDEFTGLSILQPGYDTIVRLMNMEYSAAEAAVKIANPIIVGYCNTKSPHQIAQWGHILGKISGKDQLFVPEGMKLETIQPGQQNFSDYAEYFLNAVVACTGVPKSILLGGMEGSGNRAQDIVLSRHFYTSVQRNQELMQEFFNSIFKEYGELARFEAPTLEFGDLAEDASLMTESAIKLFEVGLIDKNEAREMIGLNKVDADLGVPSTDGAIKKSNMEAWHNNPGKRPGDQSGEKKKIELSSTTTSTDGSYATKAIM